MRPKISVALAAFVALSFSISTPARSEEAPTGATLDASMIAKQEKGVVASDAAEHASMDHAKGGKMGGGMMMCEGCKSKMERQVVGTGDGGFVVIVGDKATKYDKDLAVVKEVELRTDTAGMADKMKDCKMMQGGMGDEHHKAK